MPQHKKDTTVFSFKITKEMTKDNEYRYRGIFPKPLGDSVTFRGLITKEGDRIIIEIVSQ